VADAFVLVSYPPDRASDERFGALIEGARGLVYISSTGVYGKHAELVDESTEVDAHSESNRDRLAQERFWAERKAVVIRAPGLYCPTSGLHVRLAKGTYRLPGDGTNYTSRIHLKDLGRLILAVFEHPLPVASTYLVGDLKPASQIEVITWLCAKMNLPMPQSVPLAEAPKSLQANRRVNPAKILAELNFTLEFPTYKEGFAHCLEQASLPATKS
jgi:nucleoside-diphosphate-sugar epimerase